MAVAVIGALDDPHWGIRWRAARNLGRLPRETPGAEAAAVQALSDSDPSVRMAAIETLATWDALDAIPEALLKSLQDDSDREIVDGIRKAINDSD